jgi:sugar (pentulose or hexulose) kinase
MSQTYLGFDLSTQSLRVVAIDSKYSILKETIVHFDSELDFGTSGMCSIVPSLIRVTSEVA